MGIKSKLIISLFIAALAALSYYYRQAYLYEIILKNQAIKEVAQLNSHLNALQAQVTNVARIDDEKTRELNHAKTEINRLRRLHDTDSQRLHVNATCAPAARNTATTPGLVNATSARLTDAAKHDYFTLRERIEESRLIIEGLQQYIKDICLNEQ